MNILITGAIGFIGREVANTLKNKCSIYLLVGKSSDFSKNKFNQSHCLKYDD